MVTPSAKGVEIRAWKRMENLDVIVDAMRFAGCKKVEKDCSCILNLALSWFKRTPMRVGVCKLNTFCRSIASLGEGGDCVCDAIFNSQEVVKRDCRTNMKKQKTARIHCN